MAEAEGLDAHKNAISIRLESLAAENAERTEKENLSTDEHRLTQMTNDF